MKWTPCILDAKNPLNIPIMMYNNKINKALTLLLNKWVYLLQLYSYRNRITIIISEISTEIAHKSDIWVSHFQWLDCEAKNSYLNRKLGLPILVSRMLWNKQMVVVQLVYSLVAKTPWNITVFLNTNTIKWIKVHLDL